MRIERRAEGAAEIVTLTGTLDAAVAQEVRDALKKIVAEGRTRLVIDLGAVAFIDSSGLSALVTAFKAARGAGGDVALANLTPAVRSIVELTRLHRIMDVYDTETAAVGRLS